MDKKKIAITLGVMCFVLTLAIALQYRTVKNASTIAGTNINSELKTEVLKWKERYEQTYEDLQRSEEKLEEKREAATNNNDVSSTLQKRLKTLNSLIGSIDVKGNGIIITVADNQSVTNENIGVLDNISNYLIHDSDLLNIVNELKNAGAEAISINDERIINTTAITCDGNVVLINGNKVSSPFQIKAIGSQETILGALQRTGGYLATQLKPYGLITSVERKSNITIYKYNGIMNYTTLED